MNKPKTYEEALKISPQITVTDSPFDELLTGVILELSSFNEENGKNFWEDYQNGEIDLSYWN